MSRAKHADKKVRRQPKNDLSTDGIKKQHVEDSEVDNFSKSTINLLKSTLSQPTQSSPSVPPETHNLFNQFDADNSKGVSRSEIQENLEEQGVRLTENQAANLVNIFDTNNSGELNVDQFAGLVSIGQAISKGLNASVEVSQHVQPSSSVPLPSTQRSNPSSRTFSASDLPKASPQPPKASPQPPEASPQPQKTSSQPPKASPQPPKASPQHPKSSPQPSTHSTQGSSHSSSYHTTHTSHSSSSTFPHSHSHKSSQKNDSKKKTIAIFGIIVALVVVLIVVAIILFFWKKHNPGCIIDTHPGYIIDTPPLSDELGNKFFP